MPTEITFTNYDGHPTEETAVIDCGLGEANAAAAPLDEVQPISCFAKTETGEVVGGAVGRRWGECCELQQLWVAPAHRRQGLGTRLLQAFEEHAKHHACGVIFLESFSFQAPQLYLAEGYQIEYERGVYPHGIVKYHMVKRLGTVENS